MAENEIITLQFGSFANFLSAHYFNIQEAGFSFNPEFVPDITPDRLYRASKDANSEAILKYTPRTVIVDSVCVSESPLTQEVKDLPEESLDAEHLVTLSDSQRDSSLKDLENELSCIAKGQGDFSMPHSFFKSQSVNVNSWSDFMMTPLHHRSYIYSPKEYGLFSPDALYHDGIRRSKEVSFWDNIEDSIRFFAEECDNFQGFQVISEGHTAFSGVATTSMSYLRDEYPKKVSILIPTYFLPENASNHQLKWFSCNSLTFLADSKELVDNIIPLSTMSNPWSANEQPVNRKLNNVVYKEFDKYQNSAVLAASLEYITLPYRKRDETNISMTEFNQINSAGRMISIAGILMPFPCIKGESLQNVLKMLKGSFFECLSPFGSFENPFSVDMCYALSKGIFNQKSPGSTTTEENSRELTHDLLAFIASIYSTNFVKSFLSTMNFRVPLNFPAIFNNDYNLTNSFAEIGRISEFQGLGCLMNSKTVGQHLRQLQTKAKKDSIKLSLTPEEKSEIDLNSSLDCIATLETNYRDYHEL